MSTIFPMQMRRVTYVHIFQHLVRKSPAACDSSSCNWKILEIQWMPVARMLLDCEVPEGADFTIFSITHIHSLLFSTPFLRNRIIVTYSYIVLSKYKKYRNTICKRLYKNIYITLLNDNLHARCFAKEEKRL